MHVSDVKNVTYIAVDYYFSRCYLFFTFFTILIHKLNIKILVMLIKERKREKEELFGVILVPIETLLLVEMEGS